MRLAKVSGILFMAASSACLSVNQNGSGKVTGYHAGCELTMQSNTLGGACGELVLHNTGSSTMHGWQIEFQLPADGHLVNSWNAVYSANANDILVKPLPNTVDLTPGQSITMGYCATGPATNIVLTAGLCDNSGSDGEDPTDETPPADSNTVSNPNVVADGNSVALQAVSDPNAACPFDAQLAGSAGSLSVYTGNDAVTRCSSSRSSTTYVNGTFSAEMKAAPNAGVLTSFGVTADTAGAAHGIALTLDGNDRNAVWAVITLDGVANPVRLPVNFDVAADTHTYQFEWAPTFVIVRVDGVSLSTFSSQIPPSVGSVIQTSATVGHADGTPATFTGLAQGYVSDVRYAN